MGSLMTRHEAKCRDFESKHVCKVIHILNKQTAEPMHGEDPFDLINASLVVERRQVQRVIRQS